MRLSINLLAPLALLIPVGLGAQTPNDPPACRGDMDGDRLTTTIEFADGYAVEAPWQVRYNRTARLDNGAEGIEVGASLDRIVEVDPRTGERVTTPFPEPIETTFRADNERELIHQAAQIWCLTVLRAQQEAGSDGPSQRTTTTTTASIARGKAAASASAPSGVALRAD